MVNVDILPRSDGVQSLFGCIDRHSPHYAKSSGLWSLRNDMMAKQAGCRTYSFKGDGVSGQQPTFTCRIALLRTLIRLLFARLSLTENRDFSISFRSWTNTGSYPASHWV